MRAYVWAFALAAPVGERDGLVESRRTAHGRTLGGREQLHVEFRAMDLLKAGDGDGSQRTSICLCREGPPTETEKRLR